MDPRSSTANGVGLAERPVTDVPAARPPADASRRAGGRPLPERSRDYTHLSLEALRDLRKTLANEEAKVSYWRRIIQARLDVVRAGALAASDGAYLRPVLTDARVAGSRKALLDIVAFDDIPPLPNLAELWDRQVDDGDDAALAALDADLFTAEQQLSAYRTALHARIADATGDLIARYRETPSLCLSVLPLGPERKTSE